MTENCELLVKLGHVRELGFNGKGTTSRTLTCLNSTAEYFEEDSQIQRNPSERNHWRSSRVHQSCNAWTGTLNLCPFSLIFPFPWTSVTRYLTCGRNHHGRNCLERCVRLPSGSISESDLWKRSSWLSWYGPSCKVYTLSQSFRSKSRGRVSSNQGATFTFIFRLQSEERLGIPLSTFQFEWLLFLRGSDYCYAWCLNPLPIDRRFQQELTSSSLVPVRNFFFFNI